MTLWGRGVGSGEVGRCPTAANGEHLSNRRRLHLHYRFPRLDSKRPIL
jgi:hypothetical protein